jgi:hypothetical protein
MTETDIADDYEDHRVPRTAEDEPGLWFIDLLRCVALAGGANERAINHAESYFGKDDPIVRAIKASIAAGAVTNMMWLGAFVTKERDVFSGFIQHAMAKTVLAQADVLKVPFRTAVFDPVIANTVKLDTRSIVALVTVSNEQLRYSSRDSDIMLRDILADALAQKIDAVFAEDGCNETTPVYLADEGGLDVAVAHQLTPHHFEHDLLVVRLARTLNWMARPMRDAPSEPIRLQSRA